ncbi:MAG: diaminobutyrate decarboxylase [Deltaproteobacteria bacterium]|nr:diaminobutyrate decarboxylase [Deltaproteobacteria bacterium]
MGFSEDAAVVVAALARYLEECRARRGPVLRQASMEDVIRELDLVGPVREGGLTGPRLAEFVERYLAHTTRLQHPGYLAHQVAVPPYTGALAALIDALTNNPMAIYEMGPGAASIEHFVLGWLLDKVGWSGAGVPGMPRAGGVLTHGGSLANLTALLAARNRVAPEAWEQGTPSDLVLLAPPQSHYSIARAAGILGIGQRAVRPLEVDGDGRVLPDRLPATLAAVRASGKRVMALVANAGSTGAGLYDPLREIGHFCQEEGIWFHADGAHGASALLSERHRHLLDGVARADSLVWDAHKLLRAPVLCAAVLVRDERTLDGAFREEASYLFHAKVQPGFDFIHRTVECTKAALGLRLYAVVADLGERGLAAYIDGRFALASQAYEYVSDLGDFECAVRPQSNILCFRLRGRSDEAQLAARDRLIAEGEFYVSSAVLKGARFLRIVFMHPETDLGDVRRLVEAVRSAAASRE